jgi:putative oxidoreductase
MINQRLAPYGAALLRISLGMMWISHALLKYFVFTIAGFSSFLATHGMPSTLAWPVFMIELAGGVLILLGLHGRIVSMALLPVLIGATSVHLANGWVFTSANGGWEYPVFLIAASVAHVLLGDGAFALASMSSAMSMRAKTI